MYLQLFSDGSDRILRVEVSVTVLCAIVRLT